MGIWPFKKKIDSLSTGGLLHDFTDWHSHILPGVDDGVPTMELTLEILDFYEKGGVKKIWLTPHIMEDFPNEPEELRRRFEELKNEYQGPIELRLAAENMLDSLYEERLEEGNLLPIGDDGDHLLLETSYFSAPMNFDELIDKTMRKGYYVILAHPERYRYMEEGDYKDLKRRGVIFQTNFMSLVGMYGESARRKAEWLLKNRMIELTGSDIHRLAPVARYLQLSPSRNEVLDQLLDVAHNPILT